MIEVWLYGNLWRRVSDPAANGEPPIRLPAGEADTVGRVLDRVGVDPEEVSNIFLNGRLLPRSNYPILLGYPLAAPSPLSLEGYLAMSVREGDRLGVFPRNMGAVVV
jgi:hypothetical protein